MRIKIRVRGKAAVALTIWRGVLCIVVGLVVFAGSLNSGAIIGAIIGFVLMGISLMFFNAASEMKDSLDGKKPDQFFSPPQPAVEPEKKSPPPENTEEKAGYSWLWGIAVLGVVLFLFAKCMAGVADGYPAVQLTPAPIKTARPTLRPTATEKPVTKPTQRPTSAFDNGFYYNSRIGKNDLAVPGAIAYDHNDDLSGYAAEQARNLSIPVPYIWDWHYLPEGTNATDFRNFYVGYMTSAGYKITTDDQDWQGIYLLKFKGSYDYYAVQFWPEESGYLSEVLIINWRR